MPVPMPRADRAPDADPLRRVAALAIAAAFLVPPGLVAGGPVLCPFRRATGHPCPACGLTRSWASALHGRPGESVRFHPLGMLALVIAAAYGAGVDNRSGLVPERPDGHLERARLALAAGWLMVWLVRVASEGRRER